MRKLSILMTVFAAIVFAGPALAKPGGIKVDDDNSCSINDIDEDNLIFGCTVYVWYNSNTNSAGNPSTFDWELYDNGEWVAEDTADRICSLPDWALYEVDLPGIAPKNNGKPETVTLYFYDGNGDTVGGDSFRVVCGQG